MKQYTIRYSNLVLNTLLDTIKREGRRTIDYVDIRNYERQLKIISIRNNINLDIQLYETKEDFADNIEKCAIIRESVFGRTYTLFPWLSTCEFERMLENTIYVKMDPILQITSKTLKFSRTVDDLNKLNKIDNFINNSYIEDTLQNIKLLKIQQEEEEKKLVKIKSNLNMR